MGTSNPSHPPVPFKVKVASGGRIVIPAEIRQELGVSEGDVVLLTRGPNGYNLTTYRDAIRRAQEFFAPLNKPGMSVVDELLHERREEAEREEREFDERYSSK